MTEDGFGIVDSKFAIKISRQKLRYDLFICRRRYNVIALQQIVYNVVALRQIVYYVVALRQIVYNVVALRLYIMLLLCNKQRLFKRQSDIHMAVLSADDTKKGVLF